MKHIEVMIVGAGPSGLMMAAQLLRHGIQPVIIDSKRGPDKRAKAIALHARSLELFRQMGLADKIMQAGSPSYGIQAHGQTKALGMIDFSQLRMPDTPFPFVHTITQDKTEQLLIDRLTENACPVHWETTLQSLTQNDRSVFVETVSDGTSQRWECSWIVGADGVGSAVRKFMGIPFEGKSNPRLFFLADASLTEAPHRNIHLFLPKKGFLGLLPLGDGGNYRLMGTLPQGFKADATQPIGYEDIKAIVDDMLPFTLPILKCSWVGTFAQHSRIAAQFGRQRCFLVGDAAHTHSPIGEQGMNTGLQDTANLAWKLAGVLNGRANSSLLLSYTTERYPVAKSIVGTTDWILGALLGLPTWFTSFRNYLLNKGLAYLRQRPRLLHAAFSRLSQIGTTYRHGPLAVHHAASRNVKAGDRVPFLPVYDEKAKIETDLHRWCEKPGFVLLILGTVRSHSIHIIGQWMKQKYPREMHLYYLPYSTKNQEVFDIFETKPESTKMVLIRPDMHIAYINDMVNVGLIDTYMEGVLGWKFN